jgi:predicted nucleic acid-binding Zn ribbon protein
MAAELMAVDGDEQRRRVRRSALLWAGIAAAFYVGFIVMMLVRATR